MKSLSTFVIITSIAGLPMSASSKETTSKVGNKSVAEECEAKLNASSSPATSGIQTADPQLLNCINLKNLSPEQKLFSVTDPKENTSKSMDGTISCTRKASYTIDYESCEQAVAYYNSVVTAENLMNMQQQLRTDSKNKNIQSSAAQKVAAGDAQTGMFDAAIESNKHQKNMQQEKMAAYGLAVGALVTAYRLIPGDAEAKAKCKSVKTINGDPSLTAKAVSNCDATFAQYKTTILANTNAKTALATAIATFTAKGLQAGIAMGQYNNAAKQVEAVKKTVTNDGDDMMVERCAFNPADPACKTPTVNRPVGLASPGNFGMDPGIGNNVFDMNPVTDDPIDEATSPTKDSDPIANVNSPFVKEAKEAKDIINPSAAAQTQAGNATSGGAGGGGAGAGGGSASLGTDLAGADKDGNKEASIKSNQVSASYAQGGGGGYKGVSGGKDDANPFASLFDAKSDGGIEEDRSIASEDIDGAASGLFQKISRRYGQVQADKRIEAKNLE